MDDEIGIAADWRGEMRVAGRGQAEVSEVVGGISRLLHRSQHEKRDRLFFRFALDALDQFLEVTRPKRRHRRSEAVAEA